MARTVQYESHRTGGRVTRERDRVLDAEIRIDSKRDRDGARGASVCIRMRGPGGSHRQCGSGRGYDAREAVGNALESLADTIKHPWR